MFLIIVELNYRTMNGLRRNPAIWRDYEIPKRVQ